MRFLLVDRVDRIVPGVCAEGVKCVSLADDALQDHFPDHPLLPGTLLVEALAQLGGFLVECSIAREDPPRRAVLAGIAEARFHRPCRPGDRIGLSCRLASLLPAGAQVEAEAAVEGERAARAVLTFALRAVPSPRLTEARRALYRTWTEHLALSFPLP